jgi:hypothetical protein
MIMLAFCHVPILFCIGFENYWENATRHTITAFFTQADAFLKRLLFDNSRLEIRLKHLLR